MLKFAMICLVSLALPSASAAPTDPSADRDAAIVYRIVSAQTVSERRVVFRSVTPEMKAALWRAHVRQFLASHPSLSEAQRAVIAQFLTVIDAELYRPRPDDPEWQAMTGLPFARMQQSASAVLAPELCREAFTVLGPPDPDPVGVVRTIDLAAVALHGSRKLQPDYCVGCYAPGL
jgi:hypothetical protein